MNVISIRSRLRKVEQRRRGGSEAWFFIWARTADEAEAAFKGLPEPKPTRDVVPVRWTYAEDVPAPRRSTMKNLSDLELLSICEDRAGPVSEWPARPDRITSHLSDELLMQVLLSGPHDWLQNPR